MDLKGSTSSIPIDLRDILAKLEFIAMIPRGHKININTMNFVSAESFLGSIYRACYHENRKVTLHFITATIDRTIDAINKYYNSIFLQNIINCLNTARVGITELSTTYRSDPEFVSKIIICLKDIDIQLDKYRHLIKGYEAPQEEVEPEEEKEQEPEPDTQ